MVTEISRVVGSTTFRVKGTVGNYDTNSQVYVQVFVTQDGGAVATGGGFLKADDKGAFTVTAKATAHSDFQDLVALTAVSHATEIWASSLTPPPAGVSTAPDVADWKADWAQHEPT
jgi:hypothetical protein